MLREFAIEPALLANWKNFHYLHEKFGISKARVIAQFPKNWYKMVCEEADAVGGVLNKKRVVEWLVSAKKTFLIPSGRDYKIPDDWLQSAENAHTTNPFTSILARENPRNHPEVLKWSDEETEVPEAHPLVKNEYEFRMQKTPEGFLQTCFLLLQHSHEIIFIDPYLKDGNGSFDVLKLILYSIYKSTSTEKNIRYFTIESPNGETLEYRVNELKQKLPKSIPTGMSIKIILLNDMHNRFILTERGGIKFPYGLDVRRDKHDEVNYLSENLHREIFDEYSKLKGYDITIEGQG